MMAQLVKNLPAMQEIWIQSLGQEDLLEKEMATHFSILAWEVPWTEEPGRLQYMGSQKSQIQPSDYNNINNNLYDTGQLVHLSFVLDGDNIFIF